MYKVNLSAEPNPDHDLMSHEGTVKIESHQVDASTLAEASNKVREFIEKNDLGGGNWTGGQVYEGDKQVARISYNGRIWDMEGKEIMKQAEEGGQMIAGGGVDKKLPKPFQLVTKGKKTNIEGFNFKVYELDGIKYALMTPLSGEQYVEVFKGQAEEGGSMATGGEMDASDKEKIKDIIKAHTFMQLRKPLEEAGFKVEFSTNDAPMPPAMYTVKKGSTTVAILNKKYVDEAEFVHEDIAMGEMKEGGQMKWGGETEVAESEVGSRVFLGDGRTAIITGEGEKDGVAYFDVEVKGTGEVLKEVKASSVKIIPKFEDGGDLDDFCGGAEAEAYKYYESKGIAPRNKDIRDYVATRLTESHGMNYGQAHGMADGFTEGDDDEMATGGEANTDREIAFSEVPVGKGFWIGRLNYLKIDATHYNDSNGETFEMKNPYSSDNKVRVSYKMEEGGSMATGGTMSSLKKKLQKGQGVKLVSWMGQTKDNTPPEKRQKNLDVTRYVVKVQTNGVQFSPDKNATSGSAWEFPPASLVEVSDKGFKVFGIGERDLNEAEKKIMENEPKDPEQDRIDALSDGSTMYYRRKNYYENAGYGYLYNSQWEKGLRYNSNRNKVMDKSLRGELELEYELVDTMATGGDIETPASLDILTPAKYKAIKDWAQANNQDFADRLRELDLSIGDNYAKLSHYVEEAMVEYKVPFEQFYAKGEKQFRNGGNPTKQDEADMMNPETPLSQVAREFFTKRFGKPEDDPSYYQVWYWRFWKGTERGYMDSESIKIYDEMMQKHQPTMKSGGSVNPFAVCTTSIGKTAGTQKRSEWNDEDKERYERCVLTLKSRYGIKKGSGGDLKSMYEKTGDMSNDEIVQLYPLYFEGVTIKMNEITPAIRRELAQNIFEELHTCGCQHEDEMKTGGTVRSANQLARIQNKIKKENAKLTAKEISDKWNKEAGSVKVGVSDPMTEEKVNKNVDTYRMYLNNLMFENELNEKEHTIYFKTGGELISWDLDDTTKDEDLNWTYWYGNVNQDGKEYPFTLMEMGIDVGGQEVTSHEVTWAEKTPDNSEILEKKIKDAFENLDTSLVVFKDASGLKKGGEVNRKAGKSESVTLHPYIYQGYEYPEQKVWVDAKYKHPDPLKKLMWGYGEKGGKNGSTVSDFNGLFEESGKSVTIKYNIPSGLTANQEKGLRGKAIEKFVQEGGSKKSFGGLLLGAVLGVAGTVGYQEMKKAQTEVASEVPVKDLPKKIRFYDPKDYKAIADRIHEKWDSAGKAWVKISKEQWDKFFIAGDGEDGRPEYKRKSKSEPMKDTWDGKQFVWYLEQSVMKDGGGIGTGDNVHIPSINKTGVVTNVIGHGKHFTVLFVGGEKEVYDADKVERVKDESEYKSSGGSMATGGEATGFEYILAETVSGDGYSDPEFELVPTIEKGMSLLRSEKKNMEGDGYLLDEKSASQREKDVVADFNYQKPDDEDTDYCRNQLIKVPTGKFHLVYYTEPNEVTVTSFDNKAEAKKVMKKKLDAVKWQDAEEYKNYDGGDSFGEHGEDAYVHYQILFSGKADKPKPDGRKSGSGKKGRGNAKATGSKPIHDWVAEIDFDKQILDIRKGVWTKKFDLKKGDTGGGHRNYKFKRVKYQYVLKFSIDDRNKPLIAIFDSKGTEDRARIGKVSGSVEKYMKA